MLNYYYVLNDGVTPLTRKKPSAKSIEIRRAKEFVERSVEKMIKIIIFSTLVDKMSDFAR